MAFTWPNLAMKPACGLAVGPALARAVGELPSAWCAGAVPAGMPAGAPRAAGPALAAPDRRRWTVGAAGAGPGHPGRRSV